MKKIMFNDHLALTQAVLERRKTMTRRYVYPKTAFSALIDKVSGKGTWERNLWVFAYTYKLED